MMRRRAAWGLFLILCLSIPVAASGQTSDTVNITPGTTFYLEPNYPNPFIPEDNGTTIAFTLDRDATVSLTIYDCFYNQVEYIIEEVELEQGRHKFLFNPGLRIASGMYFYSLQVHGGDRLTRRMLYIR